MYLIEKNIVAFFSFQFIFLLTGPPRLAIAIFAGQSIVTNSLMK